MRTSFLLLRIVAKAVMHATGLGGIWSVVEDLPELASNVWNEWSARSTPEDRRRELEALLQEGEEGIDVARVFEDEEVRRVLDERPAEARERVREDVGAFLRQMPAAARQTFRRPGDPTGKTVPPSLVPREARDLIPLLNVGRPHFQKGDRPIPGADWELDELFGVGGFGEVWKARHAPFRTAAGGVEVLHRPPGPPQVAHDRRRTSATASTARASTPGIVPLQATYLNTDPPCLQYRVRRWRRPRRDGPPWRGKSRILLPSRSPGSCLQIAETVAFAHRLDQRIVHRDLKPANILVCRRDGAVRFKVTDFGIGGIANAQAVAATRRGHKAGVFVTRALAGSGTPLYASPEQCSATNRSTRAMTYTPSA